MTIFYKGVFVDPNCGRVYMNAKREACGEYA